MRAWAAPVVDGTRQNQQEVELETDGLTVLTHTLPWPWVRYRYEYEPGEELPCTLDTKDLLKRIRFRDAK